MPPYDAFAQDVWRHYQGPPVPSAPAPIRWRRHLVLALLTLVTMTLGHGWKFPVVFFLILFAHEMGHYVACRIYAVDASPPYFLPGIPAAITMLFGAPPLAFIPGTFGAFIRIRAPIPHRRALFDIGIAGPLAGFAMALLFLPAAVMEIQPIPTHLVHQFADGLSNPNLFRFAVPALRGFSDDTPYLAGDVFYAVWWGCLATMLNLLPIGQLDGGHVAYALFGRGYNRLAFPLLLVMWMLVVYSHWNFALMALLITFIGPRHPPLLAEGQGVGLTRMLVAVVGLATFVAAFNPMVPTISPPPRPRPTVRHPEDYVRAPAPEPPPTPADLDYRPLKAALRFSRNALVPSFMSSDAVSKANSEASMKHPSAKVPSIPRLTASMA